MMDRFGIKLIFESQHWCPICRKFFRSDAEKVPIIVDSKSIGYVHGECKDLFNTALTRILEINQGVR